MAEESTAPKAEITRYENLSKPVKVIFLVLTTLCLGVFILFVFGWVIRGWVLEEVMYFYLLYATAGTCIFLLIPARKKDTTRVPWYDLVLAAVFFGICTYFASNGRVIAHTGWVPAPDVFDVALASVIGVMALESGRRVAGIPFMVVCLLLGIYPLFAQHMPGVLYGFGVPFPFMISSFAFGKGGMLGLPAQVMGTILIGFLLFAGMLIASGAGKFFLDFALATFGRYRGGPAKVAVLASGFFGSVSGSPLANVAATGSFTIPAMKRMGYPAHYAAAIEACASTGGLIMPPIMGVIIFIMVILTNIPYTTIMAAALIPASLYFYGLLIQVDAYAARVGLKGLPREEVPPVLKVLKEGWPFLIVVVFLVFGLVYMRWAALAPVYASLFMLVLSFTSRETMMTPRRIINALAAIGSLITYVMAILLPIGYIFLGLQLTGTLTALTAQIVTFGGGNVISVLLIAMVVCYVFGMVGMAIIPYIVLAVTVVPALVAATGLSTLGLHLFILYYLLIEFITPPVALAAFIAAGMAKAPPMKTAWTAMRLAVVLYFIPFFFLFNPSLILEGPILESLYLFAMCLLGIGILCGGLEGYLLKVGNIGWRARVPLIVGGFLLAFPEWKASIIGAVLTVIVITIILVRRRMVAGKLLMTC